MQDSERPLDDVDGPASETRGRLALVEGEKPLAREVIREFIAHAEKTGLLMSLVASKVPLDHVDDVVHDALAEALATMANAPPQSEEALPGWLRTIARRTVADFHAKRARRSKYEGPMPVEARDPVNDGADDDDRGKRAPEPSYDPRAAEAGTEVHPWLVRRWLEGQVEKSPRDKETLAILLEHAQGEKTYQAIAAERGMTVTALSSRIFEFKGKYIPRYKRWRNRALLFVILGGIIVAAVATMIAVWLLTSAAEPTAPRTPQDPLLPPAPSVQVAPTVEPSAPPQEPERDPFNQALPPRPRTIEKPPSKL